MFSSFSIDTGPPISDNVIYLLIASSIDVFIFVSLFLSQEFQSVVRWAVCKLPFAYSWKKINFTFRTLRHIYILHPPCAAMKSDKKFGTFAFVCHKIETLLYTPNIKEAFTVAVKTALLYT